ncbi:hypothetical protein BDD12DRAFT_269661 [Trichophaea hybrida]|nr:hypothetical protein BDD12DRAFT_269661 [Trichophaea hybrida]
MNSIFASAFIGQMELVSEVKENILAPRLTGKESLCQRSSGEHCFWQCSTFSIATEPLQNACRFLLTLKTQTHSYSDLNHRQCPQSSLSCRQEGSVRNRDLLVCMCRTYIQQKSKTSTVRSSSPPYLYIPASLAISSPLLSSCAKSIYDKFG